MNMGDVIKIDADIIVVGGGASGLMAAITAVEHGADVILLERQEKTGRKLSATGNGHCNFTNADMKEDYFFQSDGNGFVKKALEIFPPEKVISFFEESGIAVTERNGYYYPLSGQAELVREALLFRFLHRKKAVHKCKCSCDVVEVRKEKGVFCVRLSDGYEYTAGKVVLACGSMAAPQLGGSSSGVELAGKLGHTVIPMLPALCGLKTSYQGWEKAAGVRVMAEIFMYAGKEKEFFIGNETGELQITAYGISGILVFQLSGRAIRFLEKGESVTAVLDFLPEKIYGNCSRKEILKENVLEKNVLKEEAVKEEVFDEKFDKKDFVTVFLEEQKERYPDKSLLSAVSGILPEKLAKLLLAEVFGKQKKNRQETVQLREVEKGQFLKLAGRIHGFEIAIVGENGFEHAQAASGGVSTEEIEPGTMESKVVEGLYFSGEMMDVDAVCGGYNLQWAWASGYLAGVSAAGMDFG
jgi:hypothetical protein